MSPGDVIIEHGWLLVEFEWIGLSTKDNKNFPGARQTREVEFILTTESADPCVPSEVYARLIFTGT